MEAAIDWLRKSGAMKAAKKASRAAADGLSTQVANLAVSYEQLRGRVLAGQPDGWRLGHGLLVGKGMVAWLGACTTFESAPVTGTAAPELSGTYPVEWTQGLAARFVGSFRNGFDTP